MCCVAISGAPAIQEKDERAELKHAAVGFESEYRKCSVGSVLGCVYVAAFGSCNKARNKTV